MTGLTLAVYGQDPVSLLSRNYQLSFENEFVRVIQVHYGPHEKLRVHDHPKTPILWVYLAEGGPVRFQHIGDEDFALVRPPIHAGGFRLHPGFVEKHEVENLSDLSSDFLRVELKNVALGIRSLHGRFAPPAELPKKSLEKVEFEDPVLRITRVICQTGQTCSLSTAAPGLRIELTPVTLEAENKTIQLNQGQAFWSSAGESGPVKVTEGILHQLRIEFKKQPDPQRSVGAANRNL